MSENILDWTGISYPFRIENGSVAISTSVLNSKDGLSEHISESIKQIMTTTLGEWITNDFIGTKFRALSFTNFTSDFDTYIVYQLTKAVETQDNRVKISEIVIERNKDNSFITIKVSWDINAEIVKTYSETTTIETSIDFSISGLLEGGE